MIEAVVDKPRDPETPKGSGLAAMGMRGRRIGRRLVDDFAELSAPARQVCGLLATVGCANVAGSMPASGP